MEPIKKNHEEANNKDPASVPFFIHEAEMTRMERVNKRLLILAASGWILTLAVIVYGILTR